MWVFSVMSLASLAALASLMTGALLLPRRRSRMPAGGAPRRFDDAEEKIRALRSAGKIGDCAEALEQAARDLCGEEVAPRLRKLRECREQLARARPSAPAGGYDMEGSLRIPRVFREPDPDIGLARIFYEMGAGEREGGIRREVLRSAAIGAWALFVASLVARVLGV